VVTPIARDELRPSLGTTRHLPDHRYLRFPFRVTGDGPATSARADHVREQIEQVLLTAPGERVHRPDWGVGVELLVFEPRAEQLRTVVGKRLIGALAEALAGEVDPESLRAEVDLRGETAIVITVAYRLATIGHSVQHEFEIEVG
jgi:uncharacterized protein